MDIVGGVEGLQDVSEHNAVAGLVAVQLQYTLERLSVRIEKLPIPTS